MNQPNFPYQVYNNFQLNNLRQLSPERNFSSHFRQQPFVNYKVNDLQNLLLQSNRNLSAQRILREPSPVQIRGPNWQSVHEDHRDTRQRSQIITKQQVLISEITKSTPNQNPMLINRNNFPNQPQSPACFFNNQQKRIDVHPLMQYHQPQQVNRLEKSYGGYQRVEAQQSGPVNCSSFRIETQQAPPSVFYSKNFNNLANQIPNLLNDKMKQDQNQKIINSRSHNINDYFVPNEFQRQNTKNKPSGVLQTSVIQKIPFIQPTTIIQQQHSVMKPQEFVNQVPQAIQEKQQEEIEKMIAEKQSYLTYELRYLDEEPNKEHEIQDFQVINISHFQDNKYFNIIINDNMSELEREIDLSIFPPDYRVIDLIKKVLQSDKKYIPNPALYIMIGKVRRKLVHPHMKIFELINEADSNQLLIEDLREI